MSSIYELVDRFAALFSGLDEAFGTGAGRWIHRPPTNQDWIAHLAGTGAGIGIAPLMPDNKVNFAAIDLDEPDFEAARLMQTFVPGPSFIERSRSGNAHVWVFFEEPIEAWIPMGVLREVTLAAGKEHVEVFPKNHDFARVKLGNYINLPFHGTERPTMEYTEHEHEGSVPLSDGFWLSPQSLARFLEGAEAAKNKPQDWRVKAQWMMLKAPEDRPRSQEFGKQRSLHICAEHILSGEAGPITEGHRSVVYFSLAKMLLNCEMYDEEETVELLRALNEDSAPDSIDDQELLRIIGNASRGQYTSTGCDDPLFAPFAHPDCHIANPRR
jgi:hypothetical protein